MSGGIEEGYLFAVYGNRIRADVLSYAARFGCGNVRAANFIEERSFTMVDVSHNGNDGRSFNEFICGILFVEGFFEYVLCGFIEFKFEFYAEIRRYNARGIVVHGVVYSFHYTFFKEFLGYFYCGNAEFFGKFLNGNNIFIDNGFFDFYGLSGRILFFILFGP